MKARFIAPWLVLGSIALLAQAPSSTTQTLPQPAPQPTTEPTTESANPSPSSTHTSELGFAYSVPTDWTVVDNSSTLPDVKQQAQQNATSAEDKKGEACVQIPLTARHGDPTSLLVVVQLPFDCLGQAATEKDLPGFADGASEELKKRFDFSDPSYGSYSLGTHAMWIERIKGTLKDHPESAYTVEIACSVLKKGAVCWMAMAADHEALEVFEKGPVALEGEAPKALVPSTAFDKKPAS
jgi:hypothetical protein